MRKSFKIKTKVWRWLTSPGQGGPGDGGWHFVTLDKKLSEDIRKVFGKGMIKVAVKVGKTSWDTSLFPHRLSQAYLLAIKKNVRAKEDIWEGDKVKISFTIK